MNELRNARLTTCTETRWRAGQSGSFRKHFQARLVSLKHHTEVALSTPAPPPPHPPRERLPLLHPAGTPLAASAPPPPNPPPLPPAMPLLAGLVFQFPPPPPPSYVDVESALSFLFLLLSLQVHRASSWQRISPRSSAAVVDVL